MLLVMMEKRKCPYCGYEWKPRTASPKKCPYCLKWLPEWRERFGVDRGRISSSGEEDRLEDRKGGDESEG